jgi:hypothetical protein
MLVFCLPPAEINTTSIEIQMEEVNVLAESSSWFKSNYQLNQSEIKELELDETLINLTRNVQFRNILDTAISTWDELIEDEFDFICKNELGKTVTFDAKISSIEKYKPIIVL